MRLFEERDAAIVTGAGNGIGRAIAQALVREGVSTVFADLEAGTVQAAVREVQGERARGVAWVGDLADPAERERLLAQAHDALGSVTMLVHGASPPRLERDHLFAVDTGTWERMSAVTDDAAFHLGRELARRMIALRIAGRMLMLTSLHTDTPRNLVHYSTAKAAMGMLVKELAKGLGRFGIRVNALVPGAIAAGGFVAHPELVRHIPLGRLGEAEDLAPMALAVLSNRTGGYVTGASIVVDGGLALTNWFDPPQFEDLG